MTMMTGEHIANEPEYGMTLRDYFAAKAMQGAIANDMGESWPCEIDPTKDDDDTATICLARCCYMIADAMIAERAK